MQSRTHGDVKLIFATPDPTVRATIAALAEVYQLPLYLAQSSTSSARPSQPPADRGEHNIDLMHAWAARDRRAAGRPRRPRAARRRQPPELGRREQLRAPRRSTARRRAPLHGPVGRLAARGPRRPHRRKTSASDNCAPRRNRSPKAGAHPRGGLLRGHPPGGFSSTTRPSLPRSTPRLRG